jgi:putative integral membrane protein (TIGR02587 family)
MSAQRQRITNRDYADGLGRAFVGAILFALPLFMTMEMWWFGFTIDRFRLAIFLAASLPLLISLCHVAGFERGAGLSDDILDAFAAFAVAVVATTLILLLIGVVGPSQSVEDIVGKIAVASVPAAIGALLADKQLNDGDAGDADGADHGGEQRSYFGRLFIMMIGALFVALNVAPTEEMMVIAFQLSAWQAALLACVTLLMLHSLFFTIAFPGRRSRLGDASAVSVLIRYSCAGYGICVLSSAALLWVFGRLDGVSALEAIEFVIVLSFPAAIGAGLAHFVVGEQARD